MKISFGNEYGTTDFSSWAPEVRLTKSQVKQLADLAGIRTPERGTLNAVLTHAGDSITIQPGYYSGGTISTNVTSQPGRIVYTKHTHTTYSDQATYTTENINDNHGESETAEYDSPRGCYTKAYYYYKYKIETPACGQGVLVDGVPSEGTGVYDCPIHGRVLAGYNVWHGGGEKTIESSGESLPDEYWSADSEHRSYTVKYRLNCGKVNGQVIKAEVYYE